ATRGPDLSAVRGAAARRYHRGHVAISLFRSGDRAAAASARGALVSRTQGARAVPHAHHDSVRRTARALPRLRFYFDVATPASLITFAHFAISLPMNSRN